MTMIPNSIMRSGAPVDLSKAVRPFVSPSGKPTRKRTERGFYFGKPTYVPPSTTEGSPAPGVLTWKASQSVEVTTLEAMGFTVRWEDDPANEFEEVSRETHIERVEQTGNPDNWVEFEVADSITYKNRKNTQYFYTLGS